MRTVFAIVFALITASASAFMPTAAPRVWGLRLQASQNDGEELGAGGMADTRDPDPFVSEDPRTSISAAPSFEEYMKQRAAEQ